jgi:hypothetical protein
MIDNSANNNFPARLWFLHNWESESFFPTQAEAITAANLALKHCQDPDDGSWAVFVEDIYVGYVTHQVKPSCDGYSLQQNSDNDSPEEKLCQRVIATVLAALRYFQANREDILDLDIPHSIDNDPLSSNEIDDLCEAICLSEVQL